MKNRIILITGPKHSGKSLCARALGKITGIDVLDLDEVVEKQTGKSPRELYKEGPEIFRKAETLALVSLIQGRKMETSTLPERLIIAAGGGLIDNPEAVSLLSRHGETGIAYLDVSPETAWQRIVKTGGELPPFLKTENPRVKPAETHFALHERRAAAYKSLAHLGVQAENKTPEEIAGEIADYFML